ncbi:hypothetical protein ACROYT_G035322 [Oculina patagonica]
MIWKENKLLFVVCSQDSSSSLVVEDMELGADKILNQLSFCNEISKLSLSEQLRRCLQQQGVRAVFKSETTLRSQLVRPKDAVDSTKQDGVVYRIPCECGKVYISETGRPMQDRIKEHDRDIRLACTQTSAVAEHTNNTGHYPLWNEVKFIDRDSHWYTRRRFT